jgi:putative ABC transport system permease protein
MTPVVGDTLEFVNSPAIILGREFATRHDLHKDDRIELTTPTGAKTFTIKGFIEPQGFARALRGRLAIMDLPAAELAFTHEGMANQIDVLVDKGHTPQEVRPRIQAFSADRVRSY